MFQLMHRRWFESSVIAEVVVGGLLDGAWCVVVPMCDRPSALSSLLLVSAGTEHVAIIASFNFAAASSNQLFQSRPSRFFRS